MQLPEKPEPPTGWEVHFDDTHRYWYYWHPPTATSSWERPAEPTPCSTSDSIRTPIQFASTDTPTQNRTSTAVPKPSSKKRMLTSVPRLGEQCPHMKPVPKTKASDCPLEKQQPSKKHKEAQNANLNGEQLLAAPDQTEQYAEILSNLTLGTLERISANGHLGFTLLQEHLQTALISIGASAVLRTCAEDRVGILTAALQRSNYAREHVSPTAPTPQAALAPTSLIQVPKQRSMSNVLFEQRSMPKLPYGPPPDDLLLSKRANKDSIGISAAGPVETAGNALLEQRSMPKLPSGPPPKHLLPSKRADKGSIGIPVAGPDATTEKKQRFSKLQDEHRGSLPVKKAIQQLKDALAGNSCSDSISEYVKNLELLMNLHFADMGSLAEQITADAEEVLRQANDVYT